MYESDYEAPTDLTDAFLYHTGLFAIADKYAVTSLTSLVTKRFEELLKYKGLTSLIPAVSSVYSVEGVQKLQIMVVEEALYHLVFFMKEPSLEEILDNNPEFDKDLTKRMLEQRQKQRKMSGYIRFICDHCCCFDRGFERLVRLNT